MNTQKNVNQRLAKLYTQESTDLSSEKVDLNIPELLRISQEIESAWKETSKTINVEGRKMLDKVVADLKKLNNIVKQLRDERKDFVQKAEALGLDRATIDRELTKIDQALKSGENQSSDLTQRVAVIRNAIF